MLAGTKKEPLRLGQFIPSCDADGHFKKVQCHEGSCFCVDERGIPDLSTKTTSGKPECPGKSSHLCMFDYMFDHGNHGLFRYFILNIT